MEKITDLPELVACLEGEEAIGWDRIYSVTRGEGRLRFPTPMISDAPELQEFEIQPIMRVTNHITGESTLFNALRAQRPLEATTAMEGIPEVERTRGGAFCHPLTQTPEDLFGRVEGKHCITASNLAKYDQLHGLILFIDHDPFVQDPEVLADMLDVMRRWLERAHQYDRTSRFPFFLWNCLWRAGASIIHGHAQVLLAKEPYRYLKSWYDLQHTYQTTHHRDYCQDLILVHDALGLSHREGDAAILAHLTPVKEKEMVIVSPTDDPLPCLLARVLSFYKLLGVQSFNVALFLPPFGEEGFRIARIVDRGDLFSRSSDIGGMELYAGTSVVASDPFRLMEAFRTGTQS